MKAVRRTIGMILALVSVMLVSASAAQAAPVHMEITDAVLDLGNLSGVKAIDSDIPDPPATLTGEVNGSDVSIPKAGFVFPTKTAEVQAGLTAVINMEANEDMTGTYDPGTGDLDLTISLKASVEVMGSTCVISPINLLLSTKNTKPYIGVPYTEGLNGNGAIGARWTGLPPVTGGGLCGTIAGLIAGPGGIWMSHDIKVPETCADQPSHPGCDSADPPEKAPKLTTAPGNPTTETTATFVYTKGDGEAQPVDGFVCSLDSGAFEPCDSGTKEYTGLTKGGHTFSVKAKNSEGEGPAATYSWSIEDQPVVGPAKLGGLKVKPKSKKVKRGKKVTITAKVKNVGESAATGVKICVTAPKKLVKVKKCVSKGSLGAGKTATAKFKVTVKKKAKKGKKAVLKLKATAKGLKAKKGKATIKVK